MYLDIRELEEELDTLANQGDLTGEERERYEALKSLEDQLGGLSDDYGPALIPEHRFVEYAQDFAEEVGAIPDDNQWPVYCIDWERAARELAMDYTLVTFDGTDYLIR